MCKFASLNLDYQSFFKECIQYIPIVVADKVHILQRRTDWLIMMNQGAKSQELKAHTYKDLSLLCKLIKIGALNVTGQP